MGGVKLDRMGFRIEQRWMLLGTAHWYHGRLSVYRGFGISGGDLLATVYLCRMNGAIKSACLSDIQGISGVGQ
jgi:hypothetical protein